MVAHSFDILISTKYLHEIMTVSPPAGAINTLRLGIKI